MITHAGDQTRKKMLGMSQRARMERDCRGNSAEERLPTHFYCLWERAYVGRKKYASCGTMPPTRRPNLAWERHFVGHSTKKSRLVGDVSQERLDQMTRFKIRAQIPIPSQFPRFENSPLEAPLQNCHSSTTTTGFDSN
ncbi:hypothetical protein DL96DRAFT_1563275 [Flagelloscypha sp. PMI_526]|nr:hypothetical protein DL96DRAFT_1563275 [Flagelloscypha sp. PMI_526]